jgi:hypothetical protein
MGIDGANTDLAVLDRLYQELFVLNGSLSSADGVIFFKGASAFGPPANARSAFTSSTKALVYVSYGPA